MYENNVNNTAYTHVHMGRATWKGLYPERSMEYNLIQVYYYSGATKFGGVVKDTYHVSFSWLTATFSTHSDKCTVGVYIYLFVCFYFFFLNM